MRIFHDPIHGHIRMPRKYCEAFIDTPEFQRLKYIEQTSMRVIFPSARHDRFSHSLGVFYLAYKAISVLKCSTKNISDIVANSFVIASLLHDVGHAPFSHSLEHLYKKQVDKYFSRKSSCLRNKRDKDDFCSRIGSAAPHEFASAWLALTKFKNDIKKFDADPPLVARMITGAQYHSPINQDEHYRNILISLLNGDSIDVDKLDYILRDSWASGVSNINLNIDRILSSLTIWENNKKPKLGYRKTAISSLQQICDGRNHLYEWVVRHPRVVYWTHLLEKGVEHLSRKLGDEFTDKFFSFESFVNPVDCGNGITAFRPMDGDLLYLFKQMQSSECPELEELLTRQYSRSPLWKTPDEFRYLFKDKRSLTDKQMESLNRSLLRAEFKKDKIQPVFKSADIKFKVIQENEIFINLFDNVFSPYIPRKNFESAAMPIPFYVYIPKERMKNKEHFLDMLASI